MKGKTKMWDFFYDDMGLENINTELALANLYLNDPVLWTFDDSEPVEGSSSTQPNVDPHMVEEEEEEEEETTDEFVDSSMEDY